MRGTDEIRIAASEEDSRVSPAAIIGKGMQISATAYASSVPQRPRIEGNVPARHASASSTTAARVTRPHASDRA